MTTISTCSITEVTERQWATISFVPDDLAWFDWIIRHLEGYPMPSELAGATTRFGFAFPIKLTLFPDRWNPLNFEGYPKALETSRFLIVIVSPHSANVAWVDDQIRAFRKAGGEERIIALVVDGKPGQPGSPSDPAWLPKWLSWRLSESGFAPDEATEPVVIDARAGGPGLGLIRETLLASLLITTRAELERIGGLTPPLDLTRISEFPAEIASQPVSEVASGERSCSFWPLKSKPFIIAAIGTVGMLLFAAGWISGRLTKPEPFRSATPPAPSAPHLAVEEASPDSRPKIDSSPISSASATPTPTVDTSGEPIVASAPSTPATAAIKTPTAPEPEQPAVPISELQPPISPAISTGPNAEELPARENAESIQTLHQNANEGERALRAEWLGQIAAGDGALKKGKTLQAVDFYSAAIGSADRYLVRRSDDFSTMEAVALLCRKLGALQAQVASVAEARATFDRGRRILLHLEERAQVTASRRQCLQELEAGLKALPND